MNIVVIDDDKLVCSSLKIILETDPDIRVLETGYDGTDAVEAYFRLHPDILLMDIQMKEMSGISAAEKILSKEPEARILLLTTFSDDEYIVRALKCGARGYLLKQNYDTIIPALKAVYSGQSVFGETIVARLPELMSKAEHDIDAREFNLTEKEVELAALVADGLSNKEISEQMYLSEGTVRNYLSTILEKLQLRDRTQLAVFYLSGGKMKKS